VGHAAARRKAGARLSSRAIAALHDVADDGPFLVEAAMKYVLLGKLEAEWAGKQKDRVRKAQAKLKELGMTAQSIYYTQGRFDFVDVVEAPNPEAMLAFSVWYASQGLGRIQSLPAFDAETFEAAVKRAGA